MIISLGNFTWTPENCDFLSLESLLPGDSMWPFHPLVGGHLTIKFKGSLNHPKKGTLNHQVCFFFKLPKGSFWDVTWTQSIAATIQTQSWHVVPCTFGGTRISKVHHMSQSLKRSTMSQTFHNHEWKSSTTSVMKRKPSTTHTPFNFAKSDQWISPRSEDTRVTQMVTPLNKHVQRTRRNARTTGKQRPGLISRMPKEKLAIPCIFF